MGWRNIYGGQLWRGGARQYLQWDQGTMTEVLWLKIMYGVGLDDCGGRTMFGSGLGGLLLEYHVWHGAGGLCLEDYI